MAPATRLALTALAALGGVGTGRAQVFEIDADGTMLRAGQQAIRSEPADDLGDAVAELPEVPDAAVTRTGAVPAPAAYRAALLDAAGRYGVSAELLGALVWQESRWQAGAVSVKGAVGLAQLMPATARTLAVDPHDGSANLMGAARYLRQLLDLFDGDVERALAAYNAGPARVLRADGIPAIAETRRYVAAIIDRLSPSASGAPR